MKFAIATIAALMLAATANAQCPSGNCGGSFQILQQSFVPVQRNVIVQQAFVPARSFNLSINRGFAVAPVVAPFRSFNLSINRGFAFAPRGVFAPRFLFR